MNVIVRCERPESDTVWEPYWCALGKLLRAHATHGIDAEFATEWHLAIEPLGLPALRADLADLAEDFGLRSATAIEADIDEAPAAAPNTGGTP